MGNESSSSVKLKDNGIIVVSKPDDDDQEDASHPELKYCPTFKPLLSTSLSIPETRPMLSELVKQIDHSTCLNLCINIQSHLQQCSDAVKFDQTALMSKVSEVDQVSMKVMQHLTDRQRSFAKHAEHARKVEEVSKSLSRLQESMEKTITLANELNGLLPANLKLEKLNI